MKCQQHNCQNEATCAWYWTGPDPIASCEKHRITAITAVQIGRTMGYRVHMASDQEFAVLAEADRIRQERRDKEDADRIVTDIQKAFGEDS